MKDEIETKPLFVFDGGYGEFIGCLYSLVKNINFNGRPYIFDEVLVGDTRSVGIWLQNNEKENWSVPFEDGNNYEAVLGLFFSHESAGLGVRLVSELVNTRRDLMGQPCPPITRSTKRTPDRALKERLFIDSLERKAEAFGRRKPFKTWWKFWEK